MQADRDAAYVCFGTACSLPITNAATLAKELNVLSSV